MSWNSIKNAVGKIAPIAGTLLGGPAGAAVGGLISSALGVDNTPEAVAAALGNPDAVIKLKELESNERQHLLQMQLSTLQAELADTQHARIAHKDSKMPAVITLLLTAVCAGLLYAILTMPVAEDNKELAFTLFGTCFTLWGSCINFWVGTTRSSQEKTRIMAQ
jgi:hypothetical protein